MFTSRALKKQLMLFEYICAALSPALIPSRCFHYIKHGISTFIAIDPVKNRSRANGNQQVYTSSGTGRRAQAPALPGKPMGRFLPQLQAMYATTGKSSIPHMYFFQALRNKLCPFHLIKQQCVSAVSVHGGHG